MSSFKKAINCGTCMHQVTSLVLLAFLDDQVGPERRRIYKVGQGVRLSINSHTEEAEREAEKAKQQCLEGIEEESDITVCISGQVWEKMEFKMESLMEDQSVLQKERRKVCNLLEKHTMKIEQTENVYSVCGCKDLNENVPMEAPKDGTEGLEQSKQKGHDKISYRAKEIEMFTTEGNTRQMVTTMMTNLWKKQIMQHLTKLMKILPSGRHVEKLCNKNQISTAMRESIAKTQTILDKIECEPNLSLNQSQLTSKM